MAKKKFNQKEKKLLQAGAINAGVGVPFYAINRHYEKKMERYKEEALRSARSRRPIGPSHALTRSPMAQHVMRQASFAAADEANTYRKVAKFGKYASGFLVGLGAVEAGSAYYLRHRRGKLEKVHKPGRSKTGS